MLAKWVRQHGFEVAKRVASVRTVRAGILRAAQGGLAPNALLRRLPVEGRFELPLTAHGKQTSITYVATGHDAIGRALFWRGLDWWERDTLDVWLRIAERAEGVVDVGANTGVYALLACACNPQVRVVAYEPVPRIFALLLANVEANGFESRCETKPWAVSDNQGSALFHVPFVAVPTSASLGTTGFRGVGGDVIEVPTTTLDADLAMWPRVDLVKIDVEGAEATVLRGMAGILDRHAPAVVIECNPDGPVREVDEILRLHGYRFYHITNTGLMPREAIVPDVTENYRNYLCLPDGERSSVLRVELGLT